MEYIIGKEYVCQTEFGRDLVVYNGKREGMHFVRGVFEKAEEGYGRIMYASERYYEWKESDLDSPEQIFSTARVIERSLKYKIERHQAEMFSHYDKDGPGWLAPLIRSIDQGVILSINYFVKDYLDENLFDLGRTFWISKEEKLEKVRVVDVMSKRYRTQYKDIKYVLYSTGEVISSYFPDPNKWESVRFTEPFENNTIVL